MATPASPNPAPVRNPAWYELGAAVLATLTAIGFHWLFFRHAGGLWRDEAGLVRLATLPWHDTWEMLTHDSFPILFPAVIRGWCALGLGQTDAGLRALGLCVGLLLLGSLWFASWSMRRAVPLLALVLAGMNITVIRFDDAIRGYGIGSALAVLMLALVWRATQKTTPVNIALAMLGAVLSVQALYQNAFFVLAACVGGFVVCVAGRRRRDAALILAVGVVAALSLVPYVRPILQAQDWWVLQRMEPTFAGCWKKVSVVASFPFPHAAWLWVTLCLVSLRVAVRKVRSWREPSQALVLYSGVSLFTGILGFMIFIRSSHLPSQTWYYLPLLFFVAPCLEAVLAEAFPWVRRMLARFVILAVVLAWTIYGPHEVASRQTNVDAIAARLNAEVVPGDYIVVHPWYCGVSFDRYYHGSAPWTTLPPLADHGFHRYDLVKEELQRERPIQPVIEKAAATLQSGHRIWLVGFIPPARSCADLRPAPNEPSGWYEAPYTDTWGAQFAYFAATHAQQGGAVSLPAANDDINPDEHMFLYFAAGWKEPPVSSGPP